MWEARAPFAAVLDDPNLSVRDRLNALSLAYQAARAMLESAVGECTAAARLAPESLLPVVERRRIVEALGSAQTGSGGETTLVLGRTQLGQWLEDSRKIALLTKGPTAFRARAAAVYLGGLVMRYSDRSAPVVLADADTRESFARSITPEDRTALRVLAEDLHKAPELARLWKLLALLHLAENNMLGANGTPSRLNKSARDVGWFEFRAGLCHAQGFFQEVIDVLAPSELGSADSPAIRLLRINAMARLGRVREAASEAESAIKKYADDPRLSQASAILRASGGEMDDVQGAYDLLSRIVAVSPEDEGLRDDAICNLAIVHGLKGWRESAESLLSSVRDRTLADRVEKVRAALKG